MLDAYGGGNMREFIVENLVSTESFNIGIVVLNNLITFIMAFFLMFTYKITYSGVAYSKKFNNALGMITIVTTMIMSVISNNIALSLGMVGALSIIRFRTAVKDVRDASFIFWAIAIGVGCGVSQFALVGIGCITIFIFMLATSQIVPDNKLLLIIQGDLMAQNKIEAEVEVYFNSKIHLSMKNASQNHFELVYSLTEQRMKQAKDKNLIDIVQKLIVIQGVSNVNIVEQLDDIGR